MCNLWLNIGFPEVNPDARAVAFCGLAIFCLASLAQAQAGLTGIDWRLVSLGPAGAETDVVAGTTVTLKLAEDERVSGSTGCNNYGGTYQVRDNNISFSRIVSTRRACLDQNANEQEHRFLSDTRNSKPLSSFVEPSHDPFRSRAQRAQLRKQFRAGAIKFSV